MPVCEGECGGRCLEIKGAQIELVAHLTNEFADECGLPGVLGPGLPGIDCPMGSLVVRVGNELPTLPG